MANTVSIVSPLILPCARLLAAVPAAQRERIATGLARRAVQRQGRRLRRAQQQLRDSFPEFTPAHIQQQLQAHFVHRYRLMLALGYLRYAPLSEITATITQWHGVETLQQHQVAGRGVVMATPHFGDWERFNLAMGTQVNAAILYKPSGNPAVDRWLYRLRSRSGVTPLPVTAQGIRQVYRQLRAGGIVGILPDQAPKQGRGINAPFFGRDAYTMTLIHRLIHATGCQVMFGRCIAVNDTTTPHNIHYQLRITPAPEAIYHSDISRSATALNQATEAVVREAPEQYLWTYKRWG